MVALTNGFPPSVNHDLDSTITGSFNPGSGDMFQCVRNAGFKYSQLAKEKGDASVHMVRTQHHGSR